MIEVQTLRDLQSLKDQETLKERYLKANESYFYELLDACDLPQGVEPCLDSGPFRILDLKVDDWRALILADGGKCGLVKGCTYMATIYKGSQVQCQQYFTAS